MADEQGYYQQPPANSRSRRERAPREPRQRKEKAPREKKVKAPRPPKPPKAPREPRQKKEKAPRKPKNADPFGHHDESAGMDKKKIIIPVVIVAVVAIIGFVLLSGGLPAISLPEGGGSTTSGSTSSDAGTTSGGTNIVSASSTPVPGSIQIRVVSPGSWEGQYILNGVSQPESGMGTQTMDLGMVSGSLTASFKPIEEGNIYFVDILKDDTMIATGTTPDASGYVTAVANV